MCAPAGRCVASALIQFVVQRFIEVKKSGICSPLFFQRARSACLWDCAHLCDCVTVRSEVNCAVRDAGENCKRAGMTET